MAKAKVHVKHHFTVSHTHFYELEIDLPNGLSESEAQSAVADAKHEILGMLRDGDQYDSRTEGEYDPYDGYAEISLSNYEGEEEEEEEAEEEEEEEEEEEDYESSILSENVDQRLIGSTKFNMIRCPAGEFCRGEDEVGYEDERPLHNVKMSKAFWMGEKPVTQELWEKVMGWNPSYYDKSLKLPVECVTWYDCLVFCNKLSELEGLNTCFNLTNIEIDGNHITKADVEWLRNANGYRLPTEAEWEYGAKSGTELIYSGSDDIDDVAWYLGEKTRKGKKKKANTWGLYDMGESILEWCMDQWDENVYDENFYKNRNNGVENPILWDNSPCAHAVRGGSYWNYDADCRIALRYGHDAEARRPKWGFRLLRCEKT